MIFQGCPGCSTSFCLLTTYSTQVEVARPWLWQGKSKIEKEAMGVGRSELLKIRR